MNLLQKIEQDYLAAYKAKDALTLNVLRLLKSALKNTEIELRAPLADEQVFDVLLKQAKQRQDSIGQFLAAGRSDLADKEEAELGVLQGYLPQPLSDEELEQVVKDLVVQSSATSMRDMGKVMQLLSAEYKGRFDGKAASATVKAVLQSLS